MAVPIENVEEDGCPIGIATLSIISIIVGNLTNSGLYIY